MKKEFYQQEWFVALLVAIVVVGAVLVQSKRLERLELRAYDFGVAATHRGAGAADDIAIVAIDDGSIAELGRWPWPRGVLGETTDWLIKARPRSIGLLLDLSEPQVDPGLTALRDIRDKLNAKPVTPQTRRALAEMRALLNQAERTLDADQRLAQALNRVPRLYLPMMIDEREPAGTNVPAYLARHRLANLAGDPANMPTVPAIVPPYELFGQHTRGIGHLYFREDTDGGRRALQTVLAAPDGNYYPTLPLLLAASQISLDVRHIEFEAGAGIKLGKLYVPVDDKARVGVGVYKPASGQTHAFPTYSFTDVRSGKLPATLFTNKIVLIGLTARDTNTALDPHVTANAVASILNEDFYTAPAWALWAEIGLLLAATLYLTLAVPRLHTKTALLVSLVLLLVLLGAGQYLLVAERAWVQTVAPALLLFIGTLAIGARRFVLGSRAELQADSAHTARMLGLTFQSQGQLDLAMDNFRKLPPDESVLDLVYHLALDFERKRQFHKAVAAYDYVISHRPSFRDCKERKQRALQAENALVVGNTMVMDGTEKPKLGRYVVEKEIGRGSMGTVFLGLDPKLNRRVAIKTMALSEDFTKGSTVKLRERFFREAETAGRLHHPNIVTVFDAGEDHDLAYIAMEYLEGHDLRTHLQRGKSLTFEWILDVSIKIADALAYAHGSGVVHRDIKPENIIYDEATGSVKVTDFGIARVIATSNTQTGTILGTPLYMSPEQISGKHVDGRSDLFSFGSSLYELITGKPPFEGETVAALIHQINKAPLPDIHSLRPDAPADLVAVVKRLTQKDVKKRYQTAEQLKQDLAACSQALRKIARA